MTTTHSGEAPGEGLRTCTPTCPGKRSDCGMKSRKLSSKAASHPSFTRLRIVTVIQLSLLMVRFYPLHARVATILSVAAAHGWKIMTAAVYIILQPAGAP